MATTPSSPDNHAPNETCGAVCGKCCQRRTSDLDALLATPGVRSSVIDTDVAGLTAQLPLLDQVVGVTVAGPVLMNDVGVHDRPELMGGPIRCRESRISLRLNPERLGRALVTEPSVTVPPTLRLFDVDGNTAHATYLTEHSDRLAFEALSLTHGPSSDLCDGGDIDELMVDEVTRGATTLADTLPAPEADQVAQLDSVLADGGAARLTALPRFSDSGYARIDARQAIAGIEHAALMSMPVTLATTAPGCIQMRHDMLGGAREHRGSMVVASSGARAMINFNLISQCWVTWSQGVWGPTGSIELYDRAGHCSMIITQTGSVAGAAHEAWSYLMTDLTC